MAHDSEYFRRRAVEARRVASHKDAGEGAEVAGHLALAYAAIARRHSAVPVSDLDPAAISVADDQPLMLRD